MRQQCVCVLLATALVMMVCSKNAMASPPNAPTNLSATTISGSEVDLSWDDNSTDETNFGIERRIGISGNWYLIDVEGSDVQSWPDTTVQPGVVYFYRVRSYNGDGYSSYSNVPMTDTGYGSVYFIGEAWQSNGGVMYSSSGAANYSFSGTQVTFYWVQDGDNGGDAIIYIDGEIYNYVSTQWGDYYPIVGLADGYHTISVVPEGTGVGACWVEVAGIG